jgi:hypothetical protein
MAGLRPSTAFDRELALKGGVWPASGGRPRGAGRASGGRPRGAAGHASASRPRLRQRRLQCSSLR